MTQLEAGTAGCTGNSLVAMHLTRYCAMLLLQIIVKETSKPWYHFLTTTCAIVGGVFTVAGILDNILYSGMKMIKKVMAA